MRRAGFGLGIAENYAVGPMSLFAPFEHLGAARHRARRWPEPTTARRHARRGWRTRPSARRCWQHATRPTRGRERAFTSASARAGALPRRACASASLVPSPQPRLTPAPQPPSRSARGLHAPARRRGLPRGATSAWVCTTAGLLARQVRRPPRALRPAPREKTEGARVSSCEPRGSLSRSPKAKVGPAGRAGRPGARSATEHARTWLRRARCPQSRERGRAGRAGRGRSLEHSRTSSSVRVVARVAWVARERGRDSPPIARPEGLSGKTADRPCAGNSRPIRARSSYGEAGLAYCGSSTPVRPPPLGVAGAIHGPRHSSGDALCFEVVEELAQKIQGG